MVEVKKEGILLSKTTLGFENEGVLNPAVIEADDRFHLYYRAVSKGNYSTIGYCELASPLTIGKRSDSPVLFPQFEYEQQGLEDPRIVRLTAYFTSLTPGMMA